MTIKNKCIHVLLSIYDVHCKLRISILYMSVHVYVLCVMIVSDVSMCVCWKRQGVIIFIYFFCLFLVDDDVSSDAFTGSSLRTMQAYILWSFLCCIDFTSNVCLV